ncbi:hypothetical protein OC842_007978, partial [Tilletia horrida]
MVWLIVAAIVAATAYSLVTDFSAEVDHQYSGTANGCSAPNDFARVACADIMGSVSRPDQSMENLCILLGFLCYLAPQGRFDRNTSGQA